jgi:hypothetical protein
MKNEILGGGSWFLWKMFIEKQFIHFHIVYKKLTTLLQESNLDIGFHRLASVQFSEKCALRRGPDLVK